ncbi:MAG: hypothetical protein H6744_18635 [Deltaproteobacteria bacterium]|nr:hypothetical protein [Deltaproteobacteria bacterium]MCB9788699.1 hypothetical protein [Deltaproteobacteria bacterium]
MTRHTACISACLALLAACELPQNKNGGGSDASSDTDGGGVVRTYSLLLLVDHEKAKSSPLPGPDIDALAVFHDGEFLFAGCAQATLFDEDTNTYPENLHSDVDAASLSVREDTIGSGFLSLAGGTLYCQLPVTVTTGDSLFVWEVEGDGAERWRASFAASSEGERIQAPIHEGSGEIVVP